MASRIDSRIPIDSQVALALVTRLLAIPGRSGQERAVVETIVAMLRDAGVPARDITIDQLPRRSPVGGDVGNLIVNLRGTCRGPRRLLMAHLDTVPICVGAIPVRDGDVIRSKNPRTGLGGDDRAGAAVVLHAALELLRQKLPHPPLTLFWPAQEEIGLYGARFVSTSRLGKPRLCFNWDGSAPQAACIGATGDYTVDIVIDGIASHAGAHPEAGVSAAAIAGRAVARLVDEGWHGAVCKEGRRGTSNIGIVEGGDATNVVMPRIVLKAEARSHDPRFRREIVEAYRRAFESAAASFQNEAGNRGRATVTADLKYESFRLEPAEPCVRAAVQAIERIGLEPELRISNGGLDANWMTARGLPTVTLGCGQQANHTVDETLHIESFLQACRIGLVLATGTEGD